MRKSKAKQNRHRKIVSIDDDTGEVVEGVLVLVPPKLRMRNWLMVMQDALRVLARDRTLGSQARRVLDHLMAETDFENWVKVSQREIGEALDMKAPNVSRALTALVEHGYVEKAKTSVNGFRVYRLNPEIGWKGKVKNMEKAKRGEKPPPRLRLVHRRDEPEKG